MRKIIIIISMILICAFAQAQQYSPIYSQYLNNGLAINPAYAGSRETFSNLLMYRQQWVGFKGAPSTQTFSSHAPLVNDKIGLGVLIGREQVNVRSNYDIYTNYAYRFNVLGGKLSLGLKAGVTLFQASWDEIETTDDAVDDVFSSAENKMAVMPNAGVGAYFYSDWFFSGISVPTLLNYQEKESDEGYEMYVNINHYDFLGLIGGVLQVFDNVKVKPSALFRYRIEGIYHLDLNANFIFADRVWFGFSYRLNRDVVFMAEYQANDQIKIGYSYDKSFGDIKTYHSGSHEIMLMYEFRYKVRAEGPRYF